MTHPESSKVKLARISARGDLLSERIKLLDEENAKIKQTISSIQTQNQRMEDEFSVMEKRLTVFSLLIGKRKASG
jgi:hypothetical protein